MRKGEATRERILDIAEASVLAKGFGATSIEEIIAEAGITKSGFFYHFKDKNELARALIVRYAQTNDTLFERLFERAEQLADGDPLHSLLIGLRMLAEHLEDLPKGHPGCLVASMVYQERLFDREVRELTAQAVRTWNAFFETRLRAAAARYRPVAEVDLAQLAQSISCVVDGGIIMSRALDEPRIVIQQLLLLRAHLRMLFDPAVPVRRAA
jgi:TetR/AcrR family transcriptional repressor of nem operon